MRRGPVAQRSEQRTHNPSVPGSNPGRPISKKPARSGFCAFRDQRTASRPALGLKDSSAHTDSIKAIDSQSRIRERLQAELAKTTAELKAHMSTWEYAFAMAGGCHGGREHPVHWETHARTERLATRCRELRAQLAEHEL
jgi:hypothetical protein